MNARACTVGMLLFALMSGGAASVYGQPRADFSPPRVRSYQGSVVAPLTAPSTASAAAIVSQFLRFEGVDVSAASLAAVSRMQGLGGTTIVRLEQQIGGLRAYGIYAKATLNARGQLVRLIENFVTAAPSSVAAPGVNESQALTAALRRLYPGENPGVGAASRAGNTTTFARTPFFHDSPTVTRVAVVMADGSIGAGLLVETWREQGNTLHHTLVGAGGAVLLDELRTNSDSYGVFLEDPSKGGQVAFLGPGAGNTQSPDGWLFAGAQNSINIAGNNVNAYLDAVSNNRPDKGGDTINDGNFLTGADLTVTPSNANNREVAVQNLFYLNNKLHDTLWDHGFKEADGNFQEDNFGIGGAGSDSVLAEAQDGGGLDNANFATPGEGRNPRMQMYLWSGIPFQVVVNSPVSTIYDASAAEFGPAPTTGGKVGDVVLVNDGVDTTTDGCESLTGLSGKIALIDRGTCDFTVKVLNAQLAGAVAVIVANNVGTTETVPMGGRNRRINIPVVMIGHDDGAELRGLASPNATVRANPDNLNIDGDLDSDVVNHEYGHGLSWRLIGGMSGPLAGAIGEGASDGLAMLINGDDKIGEYVSGVANGIRRFPYHDYPNTYADVTGGEVHDDGEIYGAIAWKLYELFDADATLTIDDLFNYFVGGMKLTPATPAYEDMRDGILDAIDDAGGNAAATCHVWTAFAQFGVGEGASGVVGAGNSVNITESLTIPGGVCPP